MNYTPDVSKKQNIPIRSETLLNTKFDKMY